MDLKKKIRAFFTLTRKANDGFTLVELIVVIAILAILGGVAVPAYSGYVEKAERAADETLLAAVNKAFAAACSSNGSDIYLVTGASLNMTDRIVTGVASVDGVSNVDPYDEAFQMFYKGNEEAQFQVIRAILFDTTKHLFVDAEEGVTVALPGGGILSLTPEQVELFLDSTFADMGGTALAGQVDSVADLAAKMILAGFNVDENIDQETPVFHALVNNEAYFNAIGLTDEKVVELLGPDGDDYETLSKYLANSLVITAAGATNVTAEQAVQNLQSDPKTYIDDIKNRLGDTETAGEALSEAALIYGVYTSYVNATYSEEEATQKLGNVTGSLGLIDALTEMQNDGSGFKKYMTDQGEDDLKAYLEAMNVISGATSNGGTKDAVMNNGFTDDEIVNLLGGLLGKQ